MSMSTNNYKPYIHSSMCHVYFFIHSFEKGQIMCLLTLQHNIHRTNVKSHCNELNSDRVGQTRTKRGSDISSRSYRHQYLDWFTLKNHTFLIRPFHLSCCSDPHLCCLSLIPPSISTWPSSQHNLISIFPHFILALFMISWPICSFCEICDTASKERMKRGSCTVLSPASLSRTIYTHKWMLFSNMKEAFEDAGFLNITPKWGRGLRLNVMHSLTCVLIQFCIITDVIYRNKGHTRSLCKSVLNILMCCFSVKAGVCLEQCYVLLFNFLALPLQFLTNISG